MKRILTIATILFTGLTVMAQVPDALKLRIHDLTGNGYKDECVVRFTQGATVSFDGQYDAYQLFSSNQNVPCVYTKTQDATATPLSINSHGQLTSTSTIEVYTLTPSVGNYKLESELLGPFQSNVSITLIDRNTGSRLSIDADTSVQFTVTANDTTNSRYAIEFKTAAPVGMASISEFKSINYITNQTLHYSYAPSEMVSEIEVYDMTGKSVIAATITGNNSGEIQLPAIGTGVYFIRRNGKSGMKIEKVYVQQS